MKLMIDKCHNNHLQRIYIFLKYTSISKVHNLWNSIPRSKKNFSKNENFFSDFDYIVIDVIF